MRDKRSSDDGSTVPYWRTEKSNGRRPRVGKFGVDMGERGVYDSRNKLNDLTGREWIYFLNSVWVTAYPPTADTFGFDIRKVHPSPKPPALMRDIAKFFTKGGEWILDPFAGVGGTLIGAGLCDAPRHAVGVDLVQTYVDAYHGACEQMGVAPEVMVTGDARDIGSIAQQYREEFDFILTDPPYFDMMNKQKQGQKKKLYGQDDASPFSDAEEDIANLSYEEFLETLKAILTSAVSLLRTGRYMIVFCRDLQPTKEEPKLVHADFVAKLSEIPGVSYSGMRIWHDQSTDLYPFGYPYAFVMNQMHQYILVFRKE